MLPSIQSYEHSSHINRYAAFYSILRTFLPYEQVCSLRLSFDSFIFLLSLCLCLLISPSPRLSGILSSSSLLSSFLSFLLSSKSSFLFLFLFSPICDLRLYPFQYFSFCLHIFRSDEKYVISQLTLNLNHVNT